MQLVAYGAQDVYLTAEPTITFWKAVYRRHTNFAMESMEQTLNGTANWGNKVVCRVSRNGDLMGRCFLRTQLPVLSVSDNWCNRVGFRMLKSVELRVGGQMIDRHYATWMHIWTELSHTTDQKNLLDVLVGPKANDQYSSEAGTGNSGTGSAGMPTAGGINGGWTLNIPLLFAFNRHPGLALPLIALQYHEVEIHIEFENFSACLESSNNSSLYATASQGTLGYTSLWVDYIFLDTEERKEFAQKPHEYLIEIVQNQDTSFSAGANSVRLTFNHPTKFLTWVGRSSSNTGTTSTSPRDPFTDFTVAMGAAGNVTDSATGPIFVDDMDQARFPALSDGRLQLNGQDRFAVRTAEYFNYVQPYQHFTGCPDLGINVYSFALKPEEHQPSGSCNLSRIDNVNLLVTGAAASTSGTLSVYALSYNVFRVASGMGGLAYSN